MHVTKSITRRALGCIGRGNPERLWMHYSVALITIFALLFATHLVNRSIIDRGSAAAAAIKTSTRQVLMGHEILITAEAAVLDDPTHFQRLNKTVKRFEDANSLIMAAEIWSAELQHHYFDAPRPLHSLAKEYAVLANQLEGASLSDQQMMLTRLKTHFAQNGLKQSLLIAAALIESEAQAETARMTRLQGSLLAISIVLLLLEIVFIFVPAQLIVRSNFRKLRKQGDILRDSESNLQLANRQLEHLINHDVLTGLPNRGCLMAYLTKAIATLGATELGVLFIGLDGFKSVNESAGHEDGDAMLIAVAQALQSCVDDHNIVARVGGDEFVLVTDEPAKALVNRVRASFADPFEIRGRRLPINMSIGFLELSTEHQDPLVIMADAGLALQFAKNAGGNRAQQFERNLRDEIGSMQQLQLELSDAIKNGEIEPWFQPQIRLADGRLHGAEVLARWRHPTRGLLTPDKFLPVAERSGLMIDLDHSIWRSAMKHAHFWQQSNLWRPCISLNAAPDTIADPYLIERFLLELQRSGLTVSQVVVEVLETTLIDGKDDMAAINIDSLAECGIALELDDFGTGYASLSKLTQLPLSGIKLDRSLIAPLPDQSADSIIRAILALAAELGLHVIAEGVEENAQAEHLTNRGCAIAQGYGYARPMPSQEFGDWLSLNANRQMGAGGNQFRPAKRA